MVYPISSLEHDIIHQKLKFFWIVSRKLVSKVNVSDLVKNG